MNYGLSKVIKDVVILEVDRYISCATTNQEREQAYPRDLLVKRLVEEINKALSNNDINK